MWAAFISPVFILSLYYIKFRTLFFTSSFVASGTENYFSDVVCPFLLSPIRKYDSGHENYNRKIKLAIMDYSVLTIECSQS